MGFVWLRCHPGHKRGTMAASWYILRSKPNKEEFFWGQMIAHRIEVFYPCIRAKAVTPRTHKDKPFFPGHVFVYIDLQEISPSFLDWLPGSRGLVMHDTQPVLVPEALIVAVRRRVDQINATSGDGIPGLPAWETLVVQDSPLTGYESIFDNCVSGEERVHILLKLLRGGQVPAEELPGFELNL